MTVNCSNLIVVTDNSMISVFFCVCWLYEADQTLEIATRRCGGEEGEKRFVSVSVDECRSLTFEVSSEAYWVIKKMTRSVLSIHSVDCVHKASSSAKKTMSKSGSVAWSPVSSCYSSVLW